ncbi:MAG TPA: hypothetical protein VN445_09075 [Rectinemataceae bacterium]|nr:hypothetical protein [Rectinemataceae bacterium]
MNLLIFKAGEYPQGSWPIDRVKKFVAAYDPVNNIEAPGVVGHMDNGLVERQENELAHAWVKSLTMTEDGQVYAELPNEDVSPQLRQWLTDHNLRYVSIEIGEYDKQTPPQAPYLLRVAFLGRTIPAVPTTRIPTIFAKFLRAVGFGKGEQAETDTGVPIARFCRKIDQTVIEELAAVKPAPAAATPLVTAPSQATFSQGPAQSHGEEDSMTEKELQEDNTRLREENTRLKTEGATKDSQIAEFKKREGESEKEARKKDAESYFTPLRDKGILTPAQFKVAINQDIALDAADREQFRSLFSKDGKPILPLGSRHVASKENGQGESPAPASLSKEISSFAAKEKISYEEAARLLYEQHPEKFGKEE